MGGDSSSSGEEDGDAEWRAAINSVASTTTSTVANGTTTTSVASPDRENKPDTNNIKLYQIKVLYSSLFSLYCSLLAVNYS